MVLLGWWSLVGCVECPDATAAASDDDRCGATLAQPGQPGPTPTPIDPMVQETLAIERPQVDLLLVVDSADARSPDVHDALLGVLPQIGSWVEQADLDVHYGLLDSLGGVGARNVGLLHTNTPDLDVLAADLEALPAARESGFVRSTVYRALELQATDNEGFRRPDASLEVLVASARDDRSVAPNALEFISWLQLDPRRGGRAHGLVPPEALETLDVVTETAGEHAWPFEVEPPPGWNPDDERGEPWVPPPAAFDIEQLFAPNPPPRLFLSAPPADPTRIAVEIERKTPAGTVSFGALVCEASTVTDDCYFVYEPDTQALEWVQLPPADALAAHLTYDRRDASP